MQSASAPARQARAHYRHELRTLTYVTLDDANGGIIRNLNHDGVAVQAVARLRPEQRVRMRFELRFPRVRVEAHGIVSWSQPLGQCGIRFVDLPPRTRQQMDEWIFSNLLDSLSRESVHHGEMFGSSSTAPEVDDGLIVSAPPRSPIKIDRRFENPDHELTIHDRLVNAVDSAPRASELSSLSRPPSPRTIAWMLDSLAMIAGLLLFALVFLSITHELPRWWLTLSGTLAAAVFVAGSYWTVFVFLGKASLGARIARAVSGSKDEEEKETTDRFR